MTDPTSDMITRIRNAVVAKHTRVDLPASKLKAEIARILQDEGYIQGFRMVEAAAEKTGQQPRPMIRLFLKYGPHGERVISGLERISRAGRARRPRHQHSDDVAGRDDRTCGAKSRCRWRSSL